MNAPEIIHSPDGGIGNLDPEQKTRIEWFLVLLLMLAFVGISVAQNGLDEQIYQAQSQFQPSIKDAVKFSDVPEISDSVKRIRNISYPITSRPMFPKYQVQQIEPAKLQNEPLPRLYHALLKAGYGPVYNMPYGELWLASTRLKNMSYGAHLRHFSSSAHLKDVGYSGFSDNAANVFGKRFYRKHTLSGDLNYSRNLVHYYGYDTSLNTLSRGMTRQRYQLIEPKLRLLSHYADSTHINHDIRLGFYNLTNLHREAENNVRAEAKTSMFINSEKLNVDFLADFYNHKQANDTLNDLILSLTPSFEASGKKWHADIGLNGTLDNFKGKTRFYFYPRLNVYYDIYESIVIPYAGVTGGLLKNSMRALSDQNPFVDTTLTYVNTNNRMNLYGGLRGNISSNTSYDARVSYSVYDSLQFFVMNYGGLNLVNNRFSVVYDNATLLNLNAQIKYQLMEKWHLIAGGNYYLYNTKNLVRPYHKPEFDMTFTGIYNLQSKIILKADLFIMGRQWALTEVKEDDVYQLKPGQIKGWADMNLEAEYRYSKMMSFFVRFNNIANQRYYRWERYPSQRFNFMLGLSFVPF